MHRALTGYTPFLIVALSLLLASPVMAEGIAFRGKKISGHVAASDRHVVAFWLVDASAQTKLV
jgi:hypothetical protein